MFAEANLSSGVDEWQFSLVDLQYLLSDGIENDFKDFVVPPQISSSQAQWAIGEDVSHLVLSCPHLQYCRLD